MKRFPFLLFLRGPTISKAILWNGLVIKGIGIISTLRGFLQVLLWTKNGNSEPHIERFPASACGISLQNTTFSLRHSQVPGQWYFNGQVLEQLPVKPYRYSTSCSCTLPHSFILSSLWSPSPIEYSILILCCLSSIGCSFKYSRILLREGSLCCISVSFSGAKFNTSSSFYPPVWLTSGSLSSPARHPLNIIAHPTSTLALGSIQPFLAATIVLSDPVSITSP